MLIGTDIEHDTNLLCCISSDLLKISVLVSGTIISEMPVSTNRLVCNSGIMSEGNLTEPQGLMFRLQPSKLPYKVAQLGNCF